MNNISIQSGMNTMRVDDERVEQLLKRLDGDPEYNRVERRPTERYAYRLKNCIVEVREPESEVSPSFVVPTRDLSETGASFLHGGYIHQQSRVTLQLVSVFGTWSSVTGTVVRCTHLDGIVHEVGVMFDEPIQIRDFCPEAIKPRVLIVEDVELLARLAQRHLEHLGASLKVVSDGEDAVAAALAEKWDLILMDLELPRLDGRDAVRQLRAQHYPGLIAAVTSYTEPGVREECLRIGFGYFLSKPYSIDDLRKVLGLLQREPMWSRSHGDESRRALIETFIEQLPTRLRAVARSLPTGDMAETQRLLCALKTDSERLGFDLLGKEAAAFEADVHGGVEVEKVRRHIARLVDLAGSAQAAYRSTATARPPKVT